MKKTKKIAMQCLVAVVMVFTFLGMTQSVWAEGNTTLEVEPGYDYTRFKDSKITLNVYNWGEYISTGVDGEGMNVIKEFENLTGIKVNYTTYDTNESLYSKLKSGGAEYDIIIPSDYMVGKMVKEDMLAPLDFSNIPNYAMIGDDYKGQPFDPDDQYSVPYTWGYVGLIYNETMVDEEITSWASLWDEKYRDNILMFDNSRDAFAIAAKKIGETMNPTTEKEIDDQTAQLVDQKRVVQAYVMDQIFDKMEAGEAALAPYYAGDAITMMEENPDLNFIVPVEGTNFFIDSICIPAQSKNKEAAEMFINFLCEPQVSAENSMFIGYSTPQVKAQELLPEELRENEIAYPDAETLANMESFNVLSDDINAYMDKAWTNVKSHSANGNGWVFIVFLIVAMGLVIFKSVRKNMKRKRNKY